MNAKFLEPSQAAWSLPSWKCHVTKAPSWVPDRLGQNHFVPGHRGPDDSIHFFQQRPHFWHLGPFSPLKHASLLKHPPVPMAQMVGHPLREQEVVGSKSRPGHTKGRLKMVPVATLLVLLGAQHYKASAGSPLTDY